MSNGIPVEVEAEIVAAIRANHLKANIDVHENNLLVAEGQHATVHWDRAFVDRGGTVFGLGPYAKVPITLRFDPPWKVAGRMVTEDEITVRVYPPERLRRKLAKLLPGLPSVGPKKEEPNG